MATTLLNARLDATQEGPTAFLHGPDLVRHDVRERLEDADLQRREVLGLPPSEIWALMRYQRKKSRGFKSGL